MSMKPVAVADDWERRKSLPAMFSRKVMASSSRTNECIKKGEEVTQVSFAFLTIVRLSYEFDIFS